MATQDLFSNPRIRNHFLILVGLGVALSLVVRAFAIPRIAPEQSLSAAELLAQFVDGLTVSILVTTLVGLFLFWMTPQIIQKSDMSLVDPRDIRTLLSRSMQTSDSWYYSGAMGRYLRSVTLPVMAESSRRQSLHKRLIILVIDPTDCDVCRRYAEYRRGLHSSSNQMDEWTTSRVRTEAYATIIAVLSTMARDTSLEVTIALKTKFSTFRVDLSEDYAIITKEDKSAPALRCDQGTYFYKSYRSEVEWELRQSRELKLTDEASSLYPLNETSALNALRSLNLIPNHGDTDYVAKAVHLAQQTSDPYG